MEHLVNKCCHRAALRLATLPSSHPVAPLVRKCASRYVQRHRAPLHYLFHIFPLILPSTLEKVPPVWHDPSKLLPYRTVIASDREAAIAAEDACTDVICVYSDGSAHDGGVGAAAVLIRDGRASRRLRFHLGSDSEHTVFEAELVAALLALELIRTEPHASKATSIAVDNRAAIHALQCSKPRPGHHLAAAFRRAAASLKIRRPSPSYSLRIRWIAGHEGCAGNELADLLAKEAAEGRSSPRDQLPAYLRKTLPRSVSAAKQAHLQILHTRWSADWKADAACERYREVDPRLPGKSFMSLLSKADALRRAHASLLFQLRVGHVPLNRYLNRFAKPEDRPLKNCPRCDCANETVFHYLLVCPAYGREREALKRALKVRRELRLATLLTDDKAVVPLMRFVASTNRFPAIGTVPFNARNS